MKFIRLLSLLWLMIFVVACSRGTSDQPEVPPLTANPPAQSGPENLRPALQTGGGVISGTITVEPSLASRVGQANVVYIIARSADRPSPPLAVQQLRNVQFPYRYTLTAADLMQGGSFEGKVNIVVRVDQDGAAGPPQPGDLEGAYAGNPAMVGDQNVDVVINKAF